jgi:phosphoglycolate phosphatase
VATEAILFDVDGTIWDSYPWYSDVLAGITGRNPSEILNQLKSGASVVSLCRLLSIRDDDFKRACLKCSDRLHLFPGVRETLPKLVSRGRLLGVVTSLPGRYVLPMLSGAAIDAYFGTVVHPGNCRYRKPHPGPIKAALQELSVEPPNAIYVGDLETDQQCAEKAEIRFAWASYGYSALPVAADVQIDQFPQVLSL